VLLLLLDQENNKEIYRLVENLCITAGLPMPKIYVIESEAMNAFATGRNPKNAVIALTTGLVNKLEKSELEGVIAHELSHIGNRDILLATIVIVMVGFVTILADLFRRWSIFGGRRRRSDNDQVGAIIMIVAVVFSILSPLVATVIQLAISRKRELLADADAGLLTRYPEGLARALEKISSDPNQLQTANSMTSHLYIADPMKKKKVSFLKKLFMTHPPVQERVRALRDMEV
jgi:heat shock protein HtpX